VGMASYFNNTYRGYGYWINQFFIDKGYQRQGHGTKAFDMLLTKLKALADHRIIVSVDKENVTAIRLYQKFGFTWIRDEKYPDEVLLAIEMDSNSGVHGRLASSPP
jgi:ribosomal protein S18 acetylase RimI-like enzyme